MSKRLIHNNKTFDRNNLNLPNMKINSIKKPMVNSNNADNPTKIIENSDLIKIDQIPPKIKNEKTDNIKI